VHALALFGLFAVSAMLVCYVLESRSHWFVLLFAVFVRSRVCLWFFLQGAWPFDLFDAISSAVARRRRLTPTRCSPESAVSVFGACAMAQIAPCVR
jgi:hypothetical protein